HLKLLRRITGRDGVAALIPCRAGRRAGGRRRPGRSVSRGGPGGGRVRRGAGRDEQPYRYRQAGHVTRKPMAQRDAWTEPDHRIPPDVIHYTLRVYTQRI